MYVEQYALRKVLIGAVLMEVLMSVEAIAASTVDRSRSSLGNDPDMSAPCKNRLKEVECAPEQHSNWEDIVTLVE